MPTEEYSGVIWATGYRGTSQFLASTN